MGMLKLNKKTMLITATHIVYYHLCHRKLWLFSNGVQMEQASGSEYIAEGKLISETTYEKRPQRWRELNLGNVKMDHYDAKHQVVREVKKSPKLEHAHIAQVQYYLYHLRQHGINEASGIIEYPKQRKTTIVEPLTALEYTQIEQWEVTTKKIIEQEYCPNLNKKSYCAKCAYYQFCFI